MGGPGSGRKKGSGNNKKIKTTTDAQIKRNKIRTKSENKLRKIAKGTW